MSLRETSRDLVHAIVEGPARNTRHPLRSTARAAPATCARKMMATCSAMRLMWWPFPGYRRLAERPRQRSREADVAPPSAELKRYRSTAARSSGVNLRVGVLDERLSSASRSCSAHVSSDRDAPRTRWRRRQRAGAADTGEAYRLASRSFGALPLIHYCQCGFCLKASRWYRSPGRACW